MSALKIDKNNIQKFINSEKPVLIDFYASWCGPCRMVLPIVDEIAAEHPEYLVGKVNVEEEPELAKEFGVVSIPHLVAMQNGRVLDKMVGARPKAQILAMLD
jgi:thioredoxin 1